MNCPTCGVHALEHPASECLDTWVATAVMVWEKRLEGHDAERYVAPVYAWYDANGCRVAFCQDYINAKAWEPSKDIAAAWQVVERFKFYKWLSQSASGLWGTGPMLWTCAFAAPTNFRATADTVTLAIVRAALLTTQPSPLPSPKLNAR